MQQALHRSSLVPRGSVAGGACYEDDKAVITVRASGSVGPCPSDLFPDVSIAAATKMSPTQGAGLS